MNKNNQLLDACTRISESQKTSNGNFSFSISNLYPKISKKIISRSNFSISGKYPSIRLNKMLPWKNEDNLVLYRLIDVTSSIKVVWEYPFTLHFASEAGECNLTPNVMLATEDAIEIYDIYEEKGFEYIQSGSVLNSIIKELSLLNIKYHRVSYAQLAHSIQHSNASIIVRYARVPLSPLAQTIHKERIETIQHVNWDHYENSLQNVTHKQTLCRLIIHGKVLYDSSKPLNSSSKFYWYNSMKIPSNIGEIHHGSIFV